MGLFDFLFGNKNDTKQYSNIPLYSSMSNEPVYIKSGLSGSEYYEISKTFALSEDFESVAKLLQMSCDNGYAKGCFELSLMYERGVGVTLNTIKHKELLLKSCKGGYNGACLNLGNIYFEEKNYNLAMEYFTIAKNLGHPIAYNNIGVMYSEGFGVSINLTKAKEYFKISCEMGYNQGCKALQSLEK